MKNNQSSLIIAVVALIVSVFGVTIALGTISSNFRINGSAEMYNASWNVHFTNLTGPTIVGDATVIKEPTINDTYVGDFDIRLTKPGDSVSYDFDVTNTGNINAEIGTLTKNTPIFTSPTSTTADITIATENLEYSLVYQGTTTEVTNGDVLNAGATRKLTLKIGYKASATTFPTNAVEITNIGYALIYNQK